MNVVCSDEDFVTNNKVWWQGPIFTGGDGVLLLHVRDVRAELSVEFIKVNYVVLGSCGGNISFRMYGEVGMIALVSIEG